MAKKLNRSRRPRVRPRVPLKPKGWYERELAAADKLIIERALYDTRTKPSWNIALAARSLGIPLSTLKYKMSMHKLKRP